MSVHSTGSAQTACTLVPWETHELVISSILYCCDMLHHVPGQALAKLVCQAYCIACSQTMCMHKRQHAVYCRLPRVSAHVLFSFTFFAFSDSTRAHVPAFRIDLCPMTESDMAVSYIYVTGPPTLHPLFIWQGEAFQSPAMK